MTQLTLFLGRKMDEDEDEDEEISLATVIDTAVQGNTKCHHHQELEHLLAVTCTKHRPPTRSLSHK